MEPRVRALPAAADGEVEGDGKNPTMLFRDYYVREVRRSGTERHSVYLDVIGTGRTLRVGRREFERKARPA